MQRRWAGLLAVGLVGFSATAWAVEAGTKMFIRAKDTHLMKSSSPTAAVLDTLKPGDEVRYEGPDAKNGWHHVSSKGKSGVVYRSCLSPTPPELELQASEGSTDSRAFASSGAATKALSPGATKYGEEKQWTNETQQLTSLEALAKGVQDDDIAKQAKKHGLYAGRGK